uniref:Uncharacterized protein n=1 Tax=Plectus sambesii TaxID=2011161 RepID=A0A914VYZ2_9BILA
MPTTLTGSLHPSNKGAIDWSYHGLLAYGCHSVVVVVDPASLSVVQTLEKHRTAVIQLCWSPENYPHGPKTHSHSHVRLASADLSGQLVVWDVPSGAVHCTFSDGNRVATDIKWLPWQDTSKDFLLALHPPYSVVLWNADTGEKIWKKSYTETLHSLSLDPFNMRKLAFATSAGNVLLVDDFSANKSPSKNGQLFRISNNMTATGGNTPEAMSTVDDRKTGNIMSGGAKLIKRPIMQAFRIASNTPAKTSEEETSATANSASPSSAECPIIQLVHHHAVRHLLIMVYAREVLFMDTDSLQTVAHVLLDKHSSPFAQVLPCAQRDALFLVQANGCVTFRVHRIRASNVKVHNQLSLDVYNPAEVHYEGVCMSESVRVTKTYRFSAAALCPASQRSLVLIMSTGRMLFYDLNDAKATVLPSYRALAVSALVDFDDSLETKARSPLKLVLSGILGGLGLNPTTVRMRPLNAIQIDQEVDKDPFAMKNLAAIGTKEGALHLVDVDTFRIEKDLQVHTCAIRCLEWGGAYQVITAGYSQTLSTSTVVRNDVLITDIRTGLTKTIRPEADESPVELLRVSFYHCYLAIAFRDQPLEIWDLKSLRLLRRMSRSCPVIIDMAWSGKHHASKPLAKAGEGEGEDAGNVLPQASDSQTKAIYRENLVVLDNENHLYHVVVKGMHVRDGKEVNTQWSTSAQINAMVWKDDYLAFGDNDGRVSIWDLNAKQSRASNTQRGSVIRLQFSRLAGDHTLAVLHSDGLALWDAVKFVPLCHLLVPRDMPTSVLDLDLSGSSPVLVSADNCFRLCATSLRIQSVPIPDSIITDTFCPALLQPQAAALLRVVLADRVGFGAADGRDSFQKMVDSTKADYEVKRSLTAQLKKIDEDALVSVLRCESVARRALQTAQLMGDDWECQLWSVVAVLLERKDEAACQAFEPQFELFWGADAFRKRQMQRAAVFDAKRASPEQMDAQVESLIVLKQLDAAIHLLLNADSSLPEFYADSLKACLLSAAHSSTTCQSTVKLVATNLIAGGKISEGIQLLFLIGKGLDACRYLQSYGFWERSACLAKMALTPEECEEVLKKWAEHLSGPQVGQKTLALLVQIGLRQWDKVLELLVVLRQAGTAALLLEALREAAALDKVPDVSLVEAVYTEYAKELHAFG